MDIVEIRFDRTRNLGDYNSEKIGVTAQLTAEDNPKGCLHDLRKFVENNGQLPEKADVTTKPHAVKEAEKLAHPAVEAKAEPKKSKKVAAEKAVETETPMETSGSQTKVEPKVSETKEEKKAKAKITKYSRNLDLHKKIFSEYLDVKFPGWKTNPAKAKDISMKLDGTEFLDAEGSTLQSFKDALDKAMKA